MSYSKNLGIGVDQFINVILCGSPDETLSARAYRADQHHKVFGMIFRPLIDLIFFWQGNHCEQAYFSELERKQLPSDYSC